MKSEKAKRRRKAKKSTPLLSHSTILILSAFLIGIAAGKAPNPQMEVYLYLSGIFGVVAYFGLGRLAKLRQQRTEQREQKQEALQFEIRVSRHVPRRTNSPHRQSDKPNTNADCQYLPVVCSK